MRILCLLLALFCPLAAQAANITVNGAYSGTLQSTDLAASSPLSAAIRTKGASGTSAITVTGIRSSVSASFAASPVFLSGQSGNITGAASLNYSALSSLVGVYSAASNVQLAGVSVLAQSGALNLENGRQAVAQSAAIGLSARLGGELFNAQNVAVQAISGDITLSLAAVGIVADTSSQAAGITASGSGIVQNPELVVAWAEAGNIAGAGYADASAAAQGIRLGGGKLENLGNITAITFGGQADGDTVIAYSYAQAVNGYQESVDNSGGISAFAGGAGGENSPVTAAGINFWSQSNASLKNSGTISVVAAEGSAVQPAWLAFAAGQGSSVAVEISDGDTGGAGVAGNSAGMADAPLALSDLGILPAIYGNVSATAFAVEPSALSTMYGVQAYGVQGAGVLDIVNSGSISASAFASGNSTLAGGAAAYGVALNSGGSLVSTGKIGAQAEASNSLAIAVYAGDNAAVTLSGQIAAAAQNAYGIYFAGNGSLDSLAVMDIRFSGSGSHAFSNSGTVGIKRLLLPLGTEKILGTGASGVFSLNDTRLYLVPGSGFFSGKWYQVQGGSAESEIMSGEGQVVGAVGAVASVHPDFLALLKNSGGVVLAGQEVENTVQTGNLSQQVSLAYNPPVNEPSVGEVARLEVLLFSDALLREYMLTSAEPYQSTTFGEKLRTGWQVFARPFGGRVSFQDVSLAGRAGFGGFITGADYRAGNWRFGLHGGADYLKMRFTGAYEGRFQHSYGLFGGIHGSWNPEKSPLKNSLSLHFSSTLLYADNKAWADTLLGWEEARSKSFAWYSAVGASVGIRIGGEAEYGGSSVRHYLTPELWLSHVWQRRPAYQRRNYGYSSLDTYFSRLDNHAFFGTAGLRWTSIWQNPLPLRFSAGVSIRRNLAGSRISVSQSVDGFPQWQGSVQTEKYALLGNARISVQKENHEFSLAAQTVQTRTSQSYGAWLLWRCKF